MNQKSDIVDRLNRLWSDSPSSPNVSSSIGQYELESVVGSGGFGVVYQALDTELNRRVAIKIPRPEVLLDADKRERFNREAEMASRLSHPGIVTVHEAQLSASIPYIVSDLCRGIDLSQWISIQSEPPPWRDSVRLILQVAQALQYAHTEGVCHRDVKPANVLLVASKELRDFLQLSLCEYQPKITDFGLGKFADESMRDTRSSLIIGTPLYMAPEQIGGKIESKIGASDIYSLGVILFELLTLSLPFDGRTHLDVLNNIKNDSPAKLRKLNPNIPKDLTAICSRCLEKNPSLRYQTAGELATDLDNCLLGQPISRFNSRIRQRAADFICNDQRIVDAGWFAFWAQLTVAFWATGFWGVIGVISFATDQNISGANWIRTIFDVAFCNIGLTWPIACLGWWTARFKKTWSIWVGLAASILAFVPISAGCLGYPLMFIEFYSENPVFSFAIHFFLFTLYLFQSLLFLFACLASRKREVIRQ